MLVGFLVLGKNMLEVLELYRDNIDIYMIK